jgi:hypothetical protein|tara:strand:- start:268 stop:585 length:318 start_codon:yes stop_codon:yes gene_type:complete
MKKRILNFIRASFLVDEKSSKNWVYIFMFLILSIIMISSSHSVDKKVFRIADLKEDIKSLRSEFLDTRRVLMKYKMESFVKEKLSEKGIISSNTPPIKIIINVNK